MRQIEKPLTAPEYIQILAAGTHLVVRTTRVHTCVHRARACVQKMTNERRVCTLDLRYKPETVYTPHTAAHHGIICVGTGKEGKKIGVIIKIKNLGAAERGEWPLIIMVMNREPQAARAPARI